jgi:hypothetical protein
LCVRVIEGFMGNFLLGAATWHGDHPIAIAEEPASHVSDLETHLANLGVDA